MYLHTERNLLLCICVFLFPVCFLFRKASTCAQISHTPLFRKCCKKRARNAPGRAPNKKPRNSKMYIGTRTPSKYEIIISKLVLFGGNRRRVAFFLIAELLREQTRATNAPTYESNKRLWGFPLTSLSSEPRIEGAFPIFFQHNFSLLYISFFFFFFTLTNLVRVDRQMKKQRKANFTKW